MSQVSRTLLFNLIPNLGGGDCLFHAISHFTLLYNHQQLREMAVINIKANRSSYDETFSVTGETLLTIDGGFKVKSFDHYIELMRKLGTWGGQIEAKVLADVLERPIVILSDKSCNTRPTCFNKTARGDPLILWRTENHYVAAIPNDELVWKGVFNKLFLNIDPSPVVTAGLFNPTTPLTTPAPAGDDNKLSERPATEVPYTISDPATKKTIVVDRVARYQNGYVSIFGHAERASESEWDFVVIDSDDKACRYKTIINDDNVATRVAEILYQNRNEIIKAFLNKPATPQSAP